MRILNYFKSLKVLILVAQLYNLGLDLQLMLKEFSAFFTLDTWICSYISVDSGAVRIL